MNGNKTLEGVNERQDKDIWTWSCSEQEAQIPKNIIKVLSEEKRIPRIKVEVNQGNQNPKWTSRQTFSVKSEELNILGFEVHI